MSPSADLHDGLCLVCTAGSLEKEARAKRLPSWYLMAACTEMLPRLGLPTAPLCSMHRTRGALTLTARPSRCRGRWGHLAHCHRLSPVAGCADVPEDHSWGSFTDPSSRPLRPQALSPSPKSLPAARCVTAGTLWGGWRGPASLERRHSEAHEGAPSWLVASSMRFPAWTCGLRVVITSCVSDRNLIPCPPG